MFTKKSANTTKIEELVASRPHKQGVPGVIAAQAAKNEAESRINDIMARIAESVPGVPLTPIMIAQLETAVLNGVASTHIMTVHHHLIKELGKERKELSKKIQEMGQAENLAEQEAGAATKRLYEEFASQWFAIIQVQAMAMANHIERLRDEHRKQGYSWNHVFSDFYSDVHQLSMKSIHGYVDALRAIHAQRTVEIAPRVA